MLMYQLPRAAEYYFFMLIGQKCYSLINWTPVKSEIMISLWWNHQELMLIFEIKFSVLSFQLKLRTSCRAHEFISEILRINFSITLGSKKNQRKA